MKIYLHCCQLALVFPGILSNTQSYRIIHEMNGMLRCWVVVQVGIVTRHVQNSADPQLFRALVAYLLFSKAIIARILTGFVGPMC